MGDMPAKLDEKKSDIELSELEGKIKSYLLEK